MTAIMCNSDRSDNGSGNDSTRNSVMKLVTIKLVGDNENTGIDNNNSDRSNRDSDSDNKNNYDVK